VAEAIPVLAIDQVIVDRVKSTSAELELATQGIVKNELQAIVNLGGLLGFVVGLLQTVCYCCADLGRCAVTAEREKPRD